MRLTRLHIHRVRNLFDICLSPHPLFNLFCGKNGSGKTSILEAIHLLALGRSFRSRQIQSVISYHESALACFGEIHGTETGTLSLGIEKNRQGIVKCKLQGETCAKLSEFAQTLPIQLMTPETFKLLCAGSIERRKFIDWGVFHVEHSFAGLCQRYQRLLKQRNATLKPFVQDASHVIWEKELAAVGEAIARHREAYMAQLQPFIDRLQSSLFPELSLSMAYERGWKEGSSLEEALIQSLSRDRRLGFTSVGPHRAEISFKVQAFQAHHVLSRGQQKRFIVALHIAQAQALYEASGKKCLYLIDDLASELDRENCQKVLAHLGAQGHQVFLTGVAFEDWAPFKECLHGEMFHVEHGRITAADKKMFHVEHGYSIS